MARQDDNIQLIFRLILNTNVNGLLEIGITKNHDFLAPKSRIYFLL